MSFRKSVKLCLLILLICGVALLIVYGANARSQQENSIEISVITRETDDQKLLNLKLGIEQAASDFNANVSMIYLNASNDAKEQKTLLKREAESGADAIVLMAADSQDLAESVADVSAKVPVIAMESPVDDMALQDMVLGSNEDMARDLSLMISQTDISGKKIAILLSSANCSNIYKRAKTVKNEFNGRCKEVVIYHVPENVNEVAGFVRSLKNAKKADIFVALESQVLNQTAETFAGDEVHVPLYGIGATSQSIYYLENQAVDGIMVENDYNMGYIAMAKAAERAGNGSGNQYSTYHIDYSWINSSNIYSENNQTLLFPFMR